MKDSIKQAYDPEAFRRQGHELVDFLADMLQGSLSGDRTVLKWREPNAQYAYWEKDWQEGGAPDPMTLFREVFDHCVHLQERKYMGHQISPPAPVSALAGLLGDFMNNGMGVYEMGAPATAIERLVIRIVAKQIGFAGEADGVLTSGGTLANLTALLAARSIKASERVWTEGSQKQYALMVSEEAHYCVDRAVRIMGWGSAGIIKVPGNDRFQMRTELLPELYQQATAEGREVIAVVGSACSTATGSFDDLEAIADFCAAHDLWFHVDGAHGAALAFSQKYRPVIKGLERADSVAMDFHKMLATPSVTTALVFKDGRHSFQTFAQKAQYLFEQDGDREWYNLAKRTFECTKLMLSVRAYSILRTHGLPFLDDYVTTVTDLGIRFGQMIDEDPRLELCTPPECNIVCFRYRPAELEETALNALNEHIRRRILETGRFYIVKTQLRGRVWLRCTLTNPFTREEDLLALLREVKQFGRAGVFISE